MKRKYKIAGLVGLLLVFAASVGIAFALSNPLTAYVKTDKTVYLMDPYYWVYSDHAKPDCRFCHNIHN